MDQNQDKTPEGAPLDWAHMVASWKEQLRDLHEQLARDRALPQFAHERIERLREEMQAGIAPYFDHRDRAAVDASDRAHAYHGMRLLADAAGVATGSHHHCGAVAMPCVCCA